MDHNGNTATSTDVSMTFDYEYRTMIGEQAGGQEILIYKTNSQDGGCNSLSCLDESENSTEIYHVTMPVAHMVGGNAPSFYGAYYCIPNTTIEDKFYVFVGTNLINGIEKEARLQVRFDTCDMFLIDNNAGNGDIISPCPDTDDPGRPPIPGTDGSDEPPVDILIPPPPPVLVGG